VDAPAAVAQVITRHAPAAVVMNDFYWDLFGKSRATPYPAADIKRAMPHGSGKITAAGLAS